MKEVRSSFQGRAWGLQNAAHTVPWGSPSENRRPPIGGPVMDLSDAIGEALGMKARGAPRARRRDRLLRRQLVQLRAEFDADRGIKALHAEVASARADVPKVPDLVAAFEAKQATLTREVATMKRELATTRDKLGTSAASLPARQPR